MLNYDQEMNVQRDFGNSSPVIRYSPELQSGAAATTGFSNKNLCNKGPIIYSPSTMPWETKKKR